MKRLFALMLAGVLILGLFAGCEQDTTPTTPSTQVSEPSQSVVPSTSVSEPTEPSETEPTQPSETEPEPPSLELGYYTAEHYLYYPDLFVPSWAGKWEVPAQMLDFEEKYASFMDPDGRVMSIGHRADRNQYYPENSIEAILSAIAAGVDIVELDIAKTKDGVLVLMHDETLNATTNLVLLRGQGVEGLPESDYVCDWTLEELRQLRLLRGSRLTNYVIPTLEEAIMVCKDHCFITLDKVDRFNWQLEILPLMRKHQAYREVLIPYKYSSSYGFKVLNNMINLLESESGYKIPYLAWSGVSDVSMGSTTSQIDYYGLCKGIRASEYYPEDLPIYQPFVGKYRIEVQTLEKSHDNRATWEEIADAGLNVIFTNNYTYDLCKFIAERYFSE